MNVSHSATPITEMLTDMWKRQLTDRIRDELFASMSDTTPLIWGQRMERSGVISRDMVTDNRIHFPQSLLDAMFPSRHESIDVYKALDVAERWIESHSFEFLMTHHK